MYCLWNNVLRVVQTRKPGGGEIIVDLAKLMWEFGSISQTHKWGPHGRSLGLGDKEYGPSNIVS
jgi:hypothetical protein